MGSKKATLILGLLAMVLIISSEASSNAKEEVVEETNEVGDAKYSAYPDGYGGNGGNYPGHSGHGSYPGHGGGGYPGHGGGGGYPGHGGGGGYPGHRGYCRHGCCGGGYHGSCRRCCSFAGEAATVQTQDMTRN